MKIIAHRGGPAPYLENSIRAIQYSLEHGADGIEIDLRLSSDGIPFGFHDENLNRILGVPRRVNECSSSELLSFGSDKWGRPSDIESIISYCRSKGQVLLHFKEVNGKVLTALDSILPRNDISSILCGVSNLQDLKLLKEVRRDFEFLAFIKKPEDYREFNLPEVKVIRLWESWINKKIIRQIDNIQKELWVMTGYPVESLGGVSTSGRLKELAAMGVDGVLLNNPALFSQ